MCTLLVILISPFLLSIQRLRWNCWVSGLCSSCGSSWVRLKKKTIDMNFNYFLISHWTFWQLGHVPSPVDHGAHFHMMNDFTKFIRFRATSSFCPKYIGSYLLFFHWNKFHKWSHNRFSRHCLDPRFFWFLPLEVILLCGDGCRIVQIGFTCSMVLFGRIHNSFHSCWK